MGLSDIVDSALLLMLSTILFIATFSFPKLTVALSPTVFPRFVTVSLFILSSILMIQGLSKRLVRRKEATPARGGEAAPKRSFVIRFLLLAADALLYTILLEPAGYIIATPPCLAISMLIFGDRKWYRILLVSVLSPLFLYAIFRMIFRVPLPRSVIW